MHKKEDAHKPGVTEEAEGEDSAEPVPLPSPPIKMVGITKEVEGGGKSGEIIIMGAPPPPPPPPALPPPPEVLILIVMGAAAMLKEGGPQWVVVV